MHMATLPNRVCCVLPWNIHSTLELSCHTIQLSMPGIAKGNCMSSASNAGTTFWTCAGLNCPSTVSNDIRMLIDTYVEVTLALTPTISQISTGREQPLHDALPLLRAHLQWPPNAQPPPHSSAKKNVLCMVFRGRPALFAAFSLLVHTPTAKLFQGDKSST